VAVAEHQFALNDGVLNLRGGLVEVQIGTSGRGGHFDLPDTLPKLKGSAEIGARIAERPRDGHSARVIFGLEDVSADNHSILVPEKDAVCSHGPPLLRLLL
jgi:hypothetical protein